MSDFSIEYNVTVICLGHTIFRLKSCLSQQGIDLEGYLNSSNFSVNTLWTDL